MIKQEMIEMIKQERNDNSVIIRIRSWEDTRFTQRHGSPQRSEAGIDPVTQTWESWTTARDPDREREREYGRWGARDGEARGFPQRSEARRSSLFGRWVKRASHKWSRVALPFLE
jgi:hypothetical protein